MKTSRRQRLSRRAPVPATLRDRLDDAEETLRAIRAGEVDAVVVAGREGPQVYTLQGADHAYRDLIESMNEGALMITADKVILYANACFARMVKCPLEQMQGGSLRDFIGEPDRALLRLLVHSTRPERAKLQVQLNARDGSHVPVQLSIRRLTRTRGAGAALGVVVTDTSDAQRAEDQLRLLTHRLVNAQETERVRVAHDMHDHITQLLCAILVRIQALAVSIPAHDLAQKRQALSVRAMVGQAAVEVDRITRKLNSGILEGLGLEDSLRKTIRAFTKRTGLPVELDFVPLPRRLPAATELALHRILEDGLDNVAKHARARHAAIRLAPYARGVELTIRDDGVGFVPSRQPDRRKNARRLGLLGMRERVAAVGGTLEVVSARGSGATLVVRVLLPPPAAVVKGVGA